MAVVAVAARDGRGASRGRQFRSADGTRNRARRDRHRVTLPGPDRQVGLSAGHCCARRTDELEADPAQLHDAAAARLGHLVRLRSELSDHRPAATNLCPAWCPRTVDEDLAADGATVRLEWWAGARD